MQNANPENSANVQPNADQQVNGTAANLQNQAGAIGQEAKNQMNNIGQTAQAQVGNLSQGVQNQMQNLGQGMQNQMQNLGQAGVQQMGSLVSQFTQPLTAKVAQPPVNKDEKIYGGLAYVPFVSIACIILKPDSAFVRLHAKQGLLLTIIFMFVGILAAIVSIFGVIGAILSFLLGLVPLAILVIGIYSMYLAFTGYWWKIPVLSSVADLIPVEMLAKVSKENITGQVGVAKEDYDNRQQTITKENVQNTAPTQPADNSAVQGGSEVQK
jgi:uncharacterized membrane protein